MADPALSEELDAPLGDGLPNAEGGLPPLPDAAPADPGLAAEAGLPDLGAGDGGLPDLGMGDGGLPDLGVGDGGLPDLEAPELQTPAPPSNPPKDDFDKALEELQGLSPAVSGLQPGGSADNSSLIWGIPVEVQIVIGTADISVANLMELEKGKVVELDRRIGEPVDVMVNGKKIASGEITLMEQDDSRFGIKILEMFGG